MTITRDEWANRWLGGFCTLGVEGLLPIRHVDYAGNAPLNAVVTIPEAPAREDTSLDEALHAWGSYLGGYKRLLLIKSTDRARKLLMQAVGVENGERVGVPATTSRALSEAVKRSNGKPLFIELDAELNYVSETPGLDTTRVIWAQPVAGMPIPTGIPEGISFIDYASTLPAMSNRTLPGTAVMWGLHLSDNHRDDGALIAFNDADVYERASALLDPAEDLPDLNLALMQCSRLSGPDGIAARQVRVYETASVGLDAAGALPQAPMHTSCALPSGLVIRIPEEADPATFISYVRNENLPLNWLPEVQPVFYVANQVTQNKELTRQTAEHLSRWITSPLGPDFVEDEITHSLLGPVKAAEYTGVRWYTDLERARWYNDLMLEWYGPDHDGYRCAFEDKLPTPSLATVAASDD